MTKKCNMQYLFFIDLIYIKKKVNKTSKTSRYFIVLNLFKIHVKMKNI